MGDKDSQGLGVVGSVVKPGDSPYTLYSSDNPGAKITQVMLNGDNYNLWANEMVNALQAKRKIGFVNGTVEKPSSDGPDYESWVAVNSMVIGWIRSSIDPKVKSSVTFVSEASQLWSSLKQRRIHASVRNNG